MSTSIRDVIAREVVSNILVHRDFSSAYPAKLIIEKDWLRTENWCRPRRQGNILSDDIVIMETEIGSDNMVTRK